MSRRAEPILLAALVLLSWAASLLLGRAPAAARAGDQAPRGLVAFEQARAAAESRDWDAAAALLRLAWRDPSTRAEAASALRRLDDAGRLAPPPDAESLPPTETLLGPGFHRRETDHFVLLTDADRIDAASQAAALERTYRQFFRFTDRLGFPAAPPASKLTVVVFGDHAMYQAFAQPRDSVETRWIAGYYASGSNRAVIYDAATSPAYDEARDSLASLRDEARALRDQARTLERDGHARRAEAMRDRAEQIERHVARETGRLDDHARGASTTKLVHEAAHLLAFNTGVQSRHREQPFWLTEGLATVFETRDVGRSFGPDHLAADDLTEAALLAEAGRLVPLEAFVALAEAPPEGSIPPERMYAQARALMAFLFRFHRASLRAYLLDAADAPRDGDATPDHLPRFRAHFGEPASLQARLERWLTS